MYKVVRRIKDGFKTVGYELEDEIIGVGLTLV